MEQVIYFVWHTLCTLIAIKSTLMPQPTLVLLLTMASRLRNIILSSSRIVFHLTKLDSSQSGFWLYSKWRSTSQVYLTKWLVSLYFGSLRLPAILLFTFCLTTRADFPHLSVCPVLPFGICSPFLSTSLNLDMICHVTQRIWVSLLSTCGKYCLSGVAAMRLSHHFLDILEFQSCYVLMSAYFTRVHHLTGERKKCLQKQFFIHALSPTIHILFIFNNSWLCTHIAQQLLLIFSNNLHYDSSLLYCILLSLLFFLYLYFIYVSF